MSRISTWKGRLIEELSRDELLEVIDYLAADYERNNSPEMIRAKSRGMATMLMKGEVVSWV